MINNAGIGNYSLIDEMWLCHLLKKNDMLALIKNDLIDVIDAASLC